MNLQVSGAGGSLSPGGGDPAGVLAGVSGRAVGDLQREQGVLAGDLHSVGQLVLQGLVVLQPCRGHSATRASAGLEGCLLSGYKLTF